MSRRSTQPALYEKIRSNRAIAAPPQVKPTVTQEPLRLVRDDAAEPDQPTVWLSPGRAVRLPVGYLLLGAGLAMVLLVMAFIMGHSKGQQLEQQKLDSYLGPGTGDVHDPLLQPEPLVDITSKPSSRPLGPRTASASQPAIQTAARPSSQWGSVVVTPGRDPRIKGMSYFVLAETNEAGSKRLADFCREQGLETYVVPSNNQRRQVIAFPGFDLSVTGRSSRPVTALREKILEIGEKWKRDRKGESNLGDAYLPSKPYGG